MDIDVETHASGYIQHVHERRNELKRPPVSNIDLLIVVMSAVSPDFSTQLLDRFLVIGHSYGLQPSILITKKDLASKEEQAAIEEVLKYYEKLVIKHSLLVKMMMWLKYFNIGHLDLPY